MQSEQHYENLKQEFSTKALETEKIAYLNSLPCVDLIRLCVARIEMSSDNARQFKYMALRYTDSSEAKFLMVPLTPKIMCKFTVDMENMIAGDRASMEPRARESGGEIVEIDDD